MRRDTKHCHLIKALAFPVVEKDVHGVCVEMGVFDLLKGMNSALFRAIKAYQTEAKNSKTSMFYSFC